MNFLELSSWIDLDNAKREIMISYSFEEMQIKADKT